jgi:hypothetical protein
MVTSMPRSQDILFGVLVLAVIGLMAFHFQVIVLALLGAFACGALYLFAGMLPAREQSFLERAFTSVFLAIVLASLVLIVPGTFGAHDPELRKTVLAVAVALPVLGFCFEVLRTPRVMRGILRCFGIR